jgi:hypothetical protein
MLVGLHTIHFLLHLSLLDFLLYDICKFLELLLGWSNILLFVLHDLDKHVVTLLSKQLRILVEFKPCLLPLWTCFNNDSSLVSLAVSFHPATRVEHFFVPCVWSKLHRGFAPGEMCCCNPSLLRPRRLVIEPQLIFQRHLAQLSKLQVTAFRLPSAMTL